MCIGIGMGGTVIWENPHCDRRGRLMMTRLSSQDLLDRGAALSPTTRCVTEAKSRDVALPHGAGTMALITLDNGLDHTRPNTFGPRSLASLNAAIDAALAATSHRDRRHRQAVHPGGRRRPDRR